MPHLPVDSPPNLHTCLLNQHLQLLNCCMARRKRRHLAGGSGEAELQAAEEGVGRLGVLGPVAHLKLLESGETLCAPVSQVAGSHTPSPLHPTPPPPPPHACVFWRAGGSGRSDSDGGVDRRERGPHSAHREVREHRLSSALPGEVPAHSSHPLHVLFGAAWGRAAPTSSLTCKPSRSLPPPPPPP